MEGSHLHRHLKNWLQLSLVGGLLLASDQPPSILAAPAHETPLWVANYEGILSHPEVLGNGRVWDGEQEPEGDSGVRESRIRVESKPTFISGDSSGVGSHVMRVEVRSFADGDVTTTGDNYEASRAEVYARQAKPPSTNAALWPDPVDSTRWYQWSFALDSDWKFANEKWLLLTQWKQLAPGSPPVSIGLRDDVLILRMSGTEHPLTSVQAAEWYSLVVGIHFSPDARQGWAIVRVNNQEVLSRSFGATMALKDGMVAPTYLKQGIYRTRDWDVTHVAYFGSLTIYAFDPML